MGRNLGEWTPPIFSDFTPKKAQNPENPLQQPQQAQGLLNPLQQALQPLQPWQV